MAITVPTTAEIAAQNITNFETWFNQTVPLNDKAFLRVLAALQAGLSTSHYKYAVNRLVQNLALTATGDDLDRIGINYGVFRKPAVAAVIEIRHTGAAGTTIPATVNYTSDTSGLIYNVNASIVIPGSGIGIVEITAEEPGVAGNLTTNDTLTISRQIAGLNSTTATYESTITEGVDRETDTVYRRRVLQEIRTAGGGGNAVDHRTWAEEVTNTLRAFPFSGAPTIAPTKKLKDSDMEEPGTVRWASENSATLVKESSAPLVHSGSLSLKISRNGLNNPFAYQDPLEIGRDYTVSGYGYSDGTARPVVYNGVGTVLWTGTTASAFQFFSVSFTAVTTQLGFGSDALSGTNFAIFDTCTLEVDESLPGDRVVYIESTTAFDPDGIPDQDLLDDVRDALNTDPDTGKTRMVLGTTDEKLFVEPIVRTSFDVEIDGLLVDAAQEADLKTSLDTGVDEYLRTVLPYVEGVDSVLDRNDVITSVKLSEIIQDILNSYSASAEGITFEVTGGSPVTRYTVAQNEEAKLGTITYV